ncbi:ATP-binding domain-containing protein, partial [Pontiella sp.]|uniref:ATP-binding domain-containing protein n=1 Tax=Pontiella sp. TaxID=2837462 RepID=UPI00356B3C25
PATAAFHSGEMDAYSASTADAAILNQRGMKVRDITPPEYARFFGNGLATMGDTIRNDRELVEKFGRAFARGHAFALDDANREAVLAHLKAGNPQEGEDAEFQSALFDAVRSKTIPVGHLNEVFRQAATSRIITNAHRINQGKAPEFPEEGETGDCYFVEADDPGKALALVGKMVKDSIPKKFHFNPMEEIQILTPMQKGELGARNLNVMMQRLLNPSGDQVERFGITYRTGDKVMQTENDYDKEVYNGDIGRVLSIDNEASELVVNFDGRKVAYDFRELDELVLSYAITIHKSQGSEYPCVLIPMHMQHFVLLQRSLIYTALTRAKKLVIVLGTKKALNLAVTRAESRDRITTLAERLKEYVYKTEGDGK